MAMNARHVLKHCTTMRLYSVHACKTDPQLPKM